MESQSAKVVQQVGACERCGNFEAMEIAGKVLCADCVALAGCGCGGHGGDED